MVKRTRLLWISLLLISLLRVAFGTAPASPESQLDSLLARMTVAEKLGQLQQLDGLTDGAYRPEHPDLVRKGLLGSTLNVRGARRTNELQRIAVEQSRLKIPVLFAFDVIHGYRTVFPIPLAGLRFESPARSESAWAGDELLRPALRFTSRRSGELSRPLTLHRISRHNSSTKCRSSMPFPRRRSISSAVAGPFINE